MIVGVIKTVGVVKCTDIHFQKLTNYACNYPAVALTGGQGYLAPPFLEKITSVLPNYL